MKRKKEWIEAEVVELCERFVKNAKEQKALILSELPTDDTKTNEKLTELIGALDTKIKFYTNEIKKRLIKKC